jgi:SAM-dependent methyltransferase
MAVATPYLLDNAQAEAARRMHVLASLFDAGTQRALTGIGIRDGWDCLELGGGGGTIAHWMAQRVAPAGSVLCTDLDPRHIAPPALPNLRIRRHDIVRDELPGSGFDLIHARLVLIHIPERGAVLAKLAAALKPGGWLLIEDFDSLSMAPDRTINPHESQLAASDAMRAYMMRGGVEPRFGRTLYGRFRNLGLSQIAAEGRVVMFDRANGGAELLRVNFEQCREPLIAGGFIGATQLDGDIAALDSEEFATPSPVMWTVAGRRSLTA